MKKTALILAFVMLILSMSISANALTQNISVEEGAVVYSPFNASLSVKGKIDGAKTNTYVFMKVYPNDNPSNLYAAVSAYTVGDTFTFDNVALPDDLDSNDCTITITSLYNDKELKITDAFYYISKGIAKTLISDLNGKSTVSSVNNFFVAKEDGKN